jgi:3-oxoacyl-[acyl-carrier-protein] synthase II/nodulation protein E
MRQAIADANATPEEVSYISAHGTGTQANDSTEAAAIHQVFGNHASKIPISSTKSLHGHSIGASGALEALATVLALRENLLPANNGVTEVDPTINLDIILGQPRKASPKLVLSNSLAFGGLNAVLALRPIS